MQTQNKADNENCLDVSSRNHDSDSEVDDEQLNALPHKTLLQLEAIVFAPGENLQQIPLFLDSHVESMTFYKQ